MRRVVTIFTGGTISMAVDPIAGGNVPVLRGEQLLARTEGLAEIADVVAVDRGLTPASHFGWTDLFAIRGAIREALTDSNVAGVVVVQGTDTIEETAFFWDLLHDDPRSVVVTGAMRISSDPEWDGTTNLRDAVRVAAEPSLRDQGVVVVLAGRIEAADDVTKTHATRLDTFQSLNRGSIGEVAGDRVIPARPRHARRTVDAAQAADGVALLTAHVAMEGTLLEAAVAGGAPGVVVEATGAGNTAGSLLDAAVRAIERGVPVVLATRCPSGAASTDYAFPGGGATWVRAGALLAGHLTGPKARVALALGLGAGLDRDGLAALLADPEPFA